MKFDTTRAMELADAFALDRRAVAASVTFLKESGFEIDRGRVFGPQTRWIAFWRIGLPWLGFFLVYFLGTIGHVGRGLSLPVRVGLMTAGPAWLFLSPLALVPLGRRWGKCFESETVAARRRTAIDPPVRVVFVTPLDAPPGVLPGRPLKLARVAVIALATVMMVNLTLPRPVTVSARKVVLTVAMAFNAAVCVVIYQRNPIRPVAGELDNRDGLATLFGMARAWPRVNDHRVETRFAAAGGQTLDLAGLRELVRQVRHEWEKKPTLVVGFWSPGIGERLTLASPSARLESLATDAANGLWVPHRSTQEVLLWSDLWPFGDADPGFVALIGESSGPPTIDPEAMRRSAQLAAEIALRWARQATADAQDSSLNRDRSSQNPG